MSPKMDAWTERTMNERQGRLQRSRPLVALFEAIRATDIRKTPEWEAAQDAMKAITAENATDERYEATFQQGLVEASERSALRLGRLLEPTAGQQCEVAVWGRDRATQFSSWQCGTSGSTGTGRKAVAVIPATDRDPAVAVCTTHRDEWVERGTRPTKFSGRRR